MNKIIPAYLDSLRFKTSSATRKAYIHGIKNYIRAVGVNAPISIETYIQFLKSLNPYPPPTQRAYRAPVIDLYKYYCDEHGGNVNLLAMSRADKRYLKRTEKRRRHFDRESVNVLVEFADKKLRGDLEKLRDRAFILFIVDSGARIFEACNLKRGMIPWKTGELYIVGKGQKEEKIYFSNRALKAIKLYLNRRAKLDGESGIPLDELPLFARHDKAAGKKILPIKPGGMWASFTRRMEDAGIERHAISPHILRHEAITHYYETSRDIKQTMEFSRHARMDTVDKYTHLIDDSVKDSYNEAFNRESE